MFLVAGSCLEFFEFVNVRRWSEVVMINVFVQTKEIIQYDGRLFLTYRNMNKAMASLLISSRGKLDNYLKKGLVCSYFDKLMIFKFSFVALLLVLVLLCTYFPIQCYHNLDIDRSMHNIPDLAWKREVALLDEKYLKVSQLILLQIWLIWFFP